MIILITNEYQKDTESLMYCVYLNSMFIFKSPFQYEVEELANNLKDALEEMHYTMTLHKSYERD